MNHTLSGVASQQAEIPRELDALEEKLRQLLSAVDELGGRVSTVLSTAPEVAGNSAIKDESCPSSDIGNRIRASRTDVSRAISSITTLLHRIQL